MNLAKTYQVIYRKGEMTCVGGLITSHKREAAQKEADKTHMARLGWTTVLSETTYGTGKKGNRRPTTANKPRKRLVKRVDARQADKGVRDAASRAKEQIGFKGSGTGLAYFLRGSQQCH